MVSPRYHRHEGDDEFDMSSTLDMGDMGTLGYNDTDGHYGLAGLKIKCQKHMKKLTMVLEQLATTMAKMASGQGFGYSTSVGGATISIGYSDNLGASANRSDGGQDTTSASVDSSSSVAITYPVEDMGLTVFGGVGTEGQADGKELDHSTIGATYAFGPATIGYQINDEDDSATGGTDYETEIFGVSFMVNENFSISYGEHNTEKSGTSVDQEAESIQASYSMGGMTVNIKDSEMTGVATLY